MNYNEETIVNNPNMDDEKTQVENESVMEPVADGAASKETEGKKTDWVKNVGLGTGAAVAAGVIATLYTSGTIPEEEHNEDNNGGASSDGLTTPVVTDGNLAIAHSVNDSMSFGEAFAAAHDEVGPGGVFEWHGELYGTYTAQEWKSLSREEKAEYNSHLRVVRTPHYENNVSHHSHATTAATTHEEAQQHAEHHEAAQQHTSEEHNGGEDVHVVHTSTVEEEPEVEILGVEHVTLEDGSDVTVGGASIDGTVLAVWDVDNDGVGDLLSVDENNNGQFDEDEFSDIRDEQVAMSTFDTSTPTYDIGTDDVDYMTEV